ncbi:AbgT family transporter [uncultured Bacteroides sp.]|uniref:AbgT family transporter n=1 Tax=uncultured Bacteroides sp. TaxID=162156 RepID=UPI002AAAEA7D|nr:AbgT family transporter [uncultured Bacteroides sp.]
MKNKLRMPHPATMFLLLTVAVIMFSWIFDIYGIRVINPQTGEVIRVQSLLGAEGIRWLLRHVVTNFTGFAPLGMVMVAMFGVGVAEHSGFIGACIRKSLKGNTSQRGVILLVIFLGILSNIVGDAGYIILIPIAATLFLSVKLHPVAGIVTAYVSVACGFSANLFLSTLDPLLAGYTQEAAATMISFRGNVGPLCNYYFMFVSTFVIAAVIYFITKKNLIPSLGEYTDITSYGNYKSLTRREQRALLIALGIGLIYTLIISFATFSPWGILRGVTGSLTRSPFIFGVLFLISFGFGLMGAIYGFASGRYRSDSDVIKGLSHPMHLLGVYFVIAFFAAQMFACFEYSHLDKCLGIMGANLLTSIHTSSFVTLLLFIFFTTVINLIMVSATAKWSFMAFIFVPMFAAMGISPDLTQCAFRIGDSATNAITPFLFYMPLILAYMQQYNKQANYATLFKYTWRYSVYILLAWTAFFVVWYLLKIPMGI